MSRYAVSYREGSNGATGGRWSLGLSTSSDPESTYLLPGLVAPMYPPVSNPAIPGTAEPWWRMVPEGAPPGYQPPEWVWRSPGAAVPLSGVGASNLALRAALGYGAGSLLLLGLAGYLGYKWWKVYQPFDDHGTGSFICGDGSGKPVEISQTCGLLVNVGIPPPEPDSISFSFTKPWDATREIVTGQWEGTGEGVQLPFEYVAPVTVRPPNPKPYEWPYYPEDDPRWSPEVRIDAKQSSDLSRLSESPRSPFAPTRIPREDPARRALETLFPSLSPKAGEETGSGPRIEFGVGPGGEPFVNAGPSTGSGTPGPGTGSPPVTPGWPFSNDPPRSWIANRPFPNNKREKVRKYGKRGISIAKGFAHAVTEGLDLMKCVHSSIDKKKVRAAGGKMHSAGFRYKDANGRWKTGHVMNDQGRVITHPRPLDMMQDIMNYNQYADWQKAITCMAKAAASDFIVGKANQTANRAFLSTGSRGSIPFGLGTGPVF